MKTMTLTIIAMLAATASLAALVPQAEAHTCRSALNNCGECWIDEDHEHSWVVGGVELAYCKTVEADQFLEFVIASENGYFLLG